MDVFPCYGFTGTLNLKDAANIVTDISAAMNLVIQPLNDAGIFLRAFKCKRPCSIRLAP